MYIIKCSQELLDSIFVTGKVLGGVIVSQGLPVGSQFVEAKKDDDLNWSLYFSHPDSQEDSTVDLVFDKLVDNAVPASDEDSSASE